MKYLSLLLLIIVVFCTSQKGLYTKSVNDQNFENDTLSNYYYFDYINSLTEDDYFSRLDSIINGSSDDFFSLRMAYTKTKDYSPYDTYVSDSLKKTVGFIDSLKYKEALITLNNIHKYNFVNITSHLYAGYIYKQLGDSVKSNFHYNIYEGLLYSIYYSGDGASPKTAYIVITTKEEYEFLNWFGLKFNSQSLVSSDDYSFDLMSVTDPQTDEEHDILFNIDLAFSKMAKAFSK